MKHFLNIDKRIKVIALVKSFAHLGLPYLHNMNSEIVIALKSLKCSNTFNNFIAFYTLIFKARFPNFVV